MFCWKLERDHLPISTKIFGKKKSEKTFSREKFLKLKPVRNPYLEWSKSERGEVTITMKLKRTKKTSFLSKLFSLPKEVTKKVTLDEVGSFVWDMCDGKHTIEEMMQELSDKYKTMRQETEVALMTYFQQLANRRFIGVLVPEVKKKEGEEFSLRDMEMP